METRFRRKQSRVLDFLYFRAGDSFFILSFEWQRLTNDPGETISIGSHQRNRLEILFGTSSFTGRKSFLYSPNELKENQKLGRPPAGQKMVKGTTDSISEDG